MAIAVVFLLCLRGFMRVVCGYVLSVTGTEVSFSLFGSVGAITDYAFLW